MVLGASPAIYQSYTIVILGSIHDQSKCLAITDGLLSHSSKPGHFENFILNGLKI